MIETIPNNTRVDEVVFNPEFSTICSVGRAPFWGTIEIRYQPKEVLLEFESFENYLVSLSLNDFTIESFTHTIFHELLGVLGDIPLRVEVSARTTVHAPAICLMKNRYGAKDH